jgi:hypothetical protein
MFYEITIITCANPMLTISGIEFTWLQTIILRSLLVNSLGLSINVLLYYSHFTKQYCLPCLYLCWNYYYYVFSITHGYNYFLL